MYIMCVILCLFITLNCKVGTLQISIIIYYYIVILIWQELTCMFLIVNTTDSRESLWCITSMVASRPIRDGNEWGKRGKKSETSKTKAAVDRCQKNKMLRQRPSGIAQRPPHHAIAVPTAEQSHKDNVHSPAIGKQLKQKKSNSLAQLHLPVLDLFWATSSWESSSPPSSWSRLDSAHWFLLHDIIIQKWCEITCRCLIVNTKDFFKMSWFMILLLCRYADVYHWGTVSAVWSDSIIISTWVFSAPHISHSLFKILAYHWKFSQWAFVFCIGMLTSATILLHLFAFLIYM